MIVNTDQTPIVTVEPRKQFCSTSPDIVSKLPSLASNAWRSVGDLHDLQEKPSIETPSQVAQVLAIVSSVQATVHGLSQIAAYYKGHDFVVGTQVDQGLTPLVSSLARFKKASSDWFAHRDKEELQHERPLQAELRSAHKDLITKIKPLVTVHTEGESRLSHGCLSRLACMLTYEALGNQRGFDLDHETYGDFEKQCLGVFRSFSSSSLFNGNDDFNRLLQGLAVQSTRSQAMFDHLSQLVDFSVRLQPKDISGFLDAVVGVIESDIRYGGNAATEITERWREGSYESSGTMPVAFYDDIPSDEKFLRPTNWAISHIPLKRA